MLKNAFISSAHPDPTRLRDALDLVKVGGGVPAVEGYRDSSADSTLSKQIAPGTHRRGRTGFLWLGRLCNHP